MTIHDRLPAMNGVRILFSHSGLGIHWPLAQPPRWIAHKAPFYIFTGLMALSFGSASASLAEGAAGDDARIDTAAIIQKARPALVVLTSMNRRGQWKSFGSGFFISDDGILVTARHVAQAQDKLFAITSDGRQYSVDGFFGDDQDHDIAVLKVEGRGFSYLPLAAALPRTNQWAAVLSPSDQWAALFDPTNGVPPVCSVGRVSSLLDLPGLWTTILTTVSVRHGQSGSPLLNESGQVIGVVPHFDAKEQANASPAAIIRQIVSKSRANALLPFAKRPRTDSTAPLCFDSNFRAGVKAMGQNDWVEAERRMRRAAKDFRQSAVPLACLAVICTGRESWKATHAYCEKALRLSPDCGLVHMLDGTSLLALQRADHGVAAVRKGLELGLPDNPTRILAWTLLATVETSLGHEGQAQEALDNLRRLDADAAASLRNKLQNSTKTRFKPAAKESN